MSIKKFLINFNILLIIVAFYLEFNFSILLNLINLIAGSDGLISDYFIKGSMGASFLNAGLLGLFSIALLVYFKYEFDALAFSATMLMSGFAFFGKNILNVMPIIAGGYLYSKYTKVEFKEHVPVSFFATSFAPIVSEFLFNYNLNISLRIIISLTIGIIVGFIVIPIAKHTIRVHEGYNLYNVGFAIGIISSVLISLIKSFGYQIEKILLWYDQFHPGFYGLLYLFFTTLIIYAYIKEKSFKNYLNLLKSSGHNQDFINNYNFNNVLMNAGFNGIVSLTFLFIFKIPINGPILGGVLTIIGFSANGKHIKNITPIYIGVILATITKNLSITDPAIILTALFLTGLAPFVGQYGILAGILASFLNLSLALNTGQLHAGLNLYNTGFSIGILLIFALPLAKSFLKQKKDVL